MGAYIKDTIAFKRRSDIENKFPELEHLWLELLGRNKNSRLLLGVIYRSERILSFHCWLEQMEMLLTELVSTWDRMLVVTGDMNIDLLSPHKPFVSSYNQLLLTLNLHQLVQKAIRLLKPRPP